MIRNQKMSCPLKFWGSASLLIICFAIIYSYFGLDTDPDMSQQFISPRFGALFGTDFMGRDMFYRTIVGFKNTFLLALAIQLLAFVVGGFIGAVSGYYGGIIDEILFHILNILLSFPSILTAIFLCSIIGEGILGVLIVISIYGVVYNIKLVRSDILQTKNEDFVLALRISHTSNLQIFFHHMLPRSYYLLLPLLPLYIGHTMLGISSLSFLGFGFSMTTPELGVILKDSLRFVNRAPWLIALPGLFQFVCVFVFSIFSNVLVNELKQGQVR